MKKIILRNRQSPGDIIMLTAAVRDLHRCYPGRFVTDLRTSCPALWLENPHLTPLEEDDARVEVIDCHYPLIHRSNTQPWHFLFGYIEFLNERLGLRIQPTEFRGDIHLHKEERRWMSQVHEITGEDTPFWIIVAGGKRDFTVKWWDVRRWQAVVNHFRGRIQFVQVGEAGHHHPALEGVIDLRGKTDLRQLVRLVYHAQGVVCPVTSLMHLAAAVPVKGARVSSLPSADGECRHLPPQNRPCVVVAGGREPPHWEAYPHHQFIHTNGQLLCCDQGGCWKARTVPLGDGDAKDQLGNLCVDVVGGERKEENAQRSTPNAQCPTEPLPRCMDMITAQEVIRRIEGYFAGGAVKYLTEAKAAVVRAAEVRGWEPVFPTEPPATMNGFSVRQVAARRRLLEKAVAKKPAWPTRRFRGRGIVICGGGAKYFPCAWVAVKMLRHVGCTLPIELWHLGAREMTPEMRALVAPLGVRCVDALEVRKKHPIRRMGGWELKAYALVHTRFSEVLLLDADNVPLRNPAFLFDSPEYREHGAIFWPDFGRLAKHRAIWELCGLEYRDEPEFESGQIVVDKRRCWHALHLALHFNAHSDFYYRFVHGDKETFHLAWRRLGQSYAMPSRGVAALGGVMGQHDFQNNRLFQHRNQDKWRLQPRNGSIPGFLLERECLAFLDELAVRWQPGTPGFRRWQAQGKSAVLRTAAAQLCAGHFAYHRMGHDHRALALLPDGRVGQGAGDCETWWNLRETDAGLTLDFAGYAGLTCQLRRGRDGVWRGRWLRFERMPVELTPQPEAVGREPVGRDGTPCRPPGERSEVAGICAPSRLPRPGRHGVPSLPGFADSFPRLIHQIWLGPNPLPVQARAWAAGWRRRHPRWHYQLWTDADAATLDMVNRVAFDAAESFAMKADILRYEILLRYGGLYCDLDFECLRPIGPLLAQVGEEAFGGFEWPTVSYRRSLCNALLGALPGAALLRRAVEALPESARLHLAERHIHRAETIARATGPAFLTRCAIECPAITIFPQPVFYPRSSENAVAYARHHFWGSWRQKGERQMAGETI